MNEEIFEAIINAYPYELIYVSKDHIVLYMNEAAKKRYGNRVKVGNSIFNCHNENSKEKIEAFLKRAEEGENEMFQALSAKRPEREFFTPVKNKQGEVIGYFERHEILWDDDHATEGLDEYWEKRR